MKAFKNMTKEKASDKRKAPFWPSLVVCLVLPLYLEFMLHLLVYGSVSARIVYPLLFAAVTGMGLFALCSLLPAKANAAVALVLGFILTMYFEVQFVYNSIFGEFMSLWQVTFGATAVTNFFSQMLYGIWKALPKILLLLLPWAVMMVLVGTKKLRFPRLRWCYPVAAVALLLALHYLTIGVMRLNGTEAFSVYNLYISPDTATEISVKNIGLLSTTRLECKYLIFGAQAAPGPAVEYPDTPEPINPDDEALERCNMINIDFAQLAAGTNDEMYKKLDTFFSGVTPTQKNEYTGLLEGYNLITICAESYSPYIIDPERTPTLYKLSTEGLVFRNYFGSYASNTTNGEYTFCMGLYPDLQRSKTTASFYSSQLNYLPFCLGNAFSAQGADAYAYHNYWGDYYSRNESHPNMGYVFKSIGSGLDIPISWPSSDLDMMVASVDDYVNSGKQFTTYYMTFSGHYQYNWNNPMSAKNRALVDDLPYSDAVKAYISCNMELEAALSYLMERLESAGIADKTVIVLTNDHYPYGLSQSEYDELAGKPIDTTFERFRNSFICYVPGMHVDVDTYCSTVDILPTLLNLFGLEYDSRLLVGRDVLSPEARDYAVLSDQSFIAREFAFDASTGTVTYYTDTPSVDESRISEIQDQIALNFQISVDILNSDYYSHALSGYKEETAHLSFDDYAFTDIPEALKLDALNYVYGNDLMAPITETKFGFEAECAYAELLNLLYGMSGSTDGDGATRVSLGMDRAITGNYAPALTWAKDNDLINPSAYNMDSYTSAQYKSAAFSFYRYAELYGYDMSVDENSVAYYSRKCPQLDEAEVRALCWCFRNGILGDGTAVGDFINQAEDPILRYSVINASYTLQLRFPAIGDGETDASHLTHTPGAAVRENEVPATCLSAGSFDEVVYCTGCGRVLSREKKTIPQLTEHTPGAAVHENEVSATCISTGTYEEVVYCSSCGEELSRENKISAKLNTHTPGNIVYIPEVAATCEYEGYCIEVVYCALCNEKISEEGIFTDKLPHTPGDPVHENETEESYDEVVYCTVCGTQISRVQRTKN